MRTARWSGRSGPRRRPPPATERASNDTHLPDVARITHPAKRIRAGAPASRVGGAPYDDGVADGRSRDWSEDEIIVVADLVRRRGWADLRARDPEVIALSDLLRSLNREAAEADPKFRGPASVSRKVADLVTAHPGYAGSPTKGGVLTREIAKSFAAHPEEMSRVAATTLTVWKKAAAAGLDPLDTGELDPFEDAGAAEGRVILAWHYRRERDPAIRRRKIEAVLKAHGALACEVCGFDFGRAYGDHGDGYIEVHHVVPLHASGETTTKLADLAMLCSNCHRMIHRRTPWLTPEELRERVRRAG